MSKPFFTDAQREFTNKCSCHLRDLFAAESHLPAGVKRDEASFAQLSAAWEKSKGTARPIHLNHEAQKRHAELAAMIVQAGGPPPPAAPAFQTSPEWDTTFSAMESQVLELHAAEDRRRAALKATGSRIDAVQAKKDAEAKATQARYDAWIASQIPSRPAGAALPTGTPTKFKSNTDAEVIATLKNFGPKADKDAAAVEMEKRGYAVDRAAEKVFITSGDFEAMSHPERNAVIRQGFSVREGPKSKSPTEISKEGELTFPSSPKGRTFRTANQLFAMSAAERNTAIAEAADEKGGREIRQEFFDALDSFQRGSWRNHEIAGGLASVPFFEKFRPIFQSCNLYGPHAATVNDPAPPVEANAMNAGQFLALDEGSKERVRFAVQLEKPGRNQRAELKRAYRNGSSAEKAALLGHFKQGLTAFPTELI